MSTEAPPPYASEGGVPQQAQAPPSYNPAVPQQPVQQVISQPVVYQQPQQVVYAQPVQQVPYGGQVQPVQMVQHQQVQQPVQQIVSPQGQPLQVQYVQAPQPAPTIIQGLLDPSLKQTLLQISLNQIKFFDALYLSYPTLVKSPVFINKEEDFWKTIITDYEQYMYKVSQNPNLSIQMSLEMELIWRVHMLNPTNYFNDCMRCFGKLIGHNCASPDIQYIKHNATNFKQQLNANTVYSGFIGGDLIMTEALLRQIKFIGRIININHHSNIIEYQLRSAIDRYDKFMQCMFDPDKQSVLLVPTLDIDLIWHSHQLDPGSYYNFCITHSPSKQPTSHNDNLAADILNKNRVNTQALWDKKFGAGDYDKVEFYEPAIPQNQDDANNNNQPSFLSNICSGLSRTQRQLLILSLVVIVIFAIAWGATGNAGAGIGYGILAMAIGGIFMCCRNGWCTDCGSGGGGSRRGGGRSGGGG